MIKRFLFTFLGLFVLVGQNFGQNITLEGYIQDRNSQEGLSDIQLFIVNTQQLYSTNDSGYFQLMHLSEGQYWLRLIYNNEIFDSVRIDCSSSTDVLSIMVDRPKEYRSSVWGSITSSALAVNNVTEDEAFDEEAPDRASTYIGSGGGALSDLTSTYLAQYGFRSRAAGRNAQYVYLDGVLVNDLESGGVSWADWAGLSHAIRKPYTSSGISTNTGLPNTLNGGVQYDLQESPNDKGLKLAYAMANRTYRHHIQCSYAVTARRGWSYKWAYSKSWAEESYVPGTFFDAQAFLLALHRTWKQAHNWGLTIIASPYQRTISSPVTTELYQLSGNSYYNPNWGWQSGEKRNARLQSAFVPMIVMKYNFSPTDNNGLETNLGFQIGNRSRSTLDWYEASDPRPNYYRYLPYFYKDNVYAQEMLQQQLSQHPEQLQIDWTSLYRANMLNERVLNNINGNVADSINGRRALYVIAADRSALWRLNIGMKYSYKKAHWTGVLAVQSIWQKKEYSRRLEDLLGADYFVNFNQFAAQKYPGNGQVLQYDLLHENQPVFVGTIYRYHYAINSSRHYVWAALHHQAYRLDCSADVQIGLNTFRRVGYMQYGLFADRSYGKGDVFQFPFYQLSLSTRYVFNFYNSLFLKLFHRVEGPDATQLWIAPRVHHMAVSTADLQKTISIEAGFDVGSPVWQCRTLLYTTGMSDLIRVQRFYNDDPEYRSFVNFVMSHMNTRSIGLEWQAVWQFHPQWKLESVANIGQCFYTNNPRVAIYNDNDTGSEIGQQELFIRNYYLGVGPQTSLALSLQFDASKKWFVKTVATYLDRNYVSINPQRRTREAAGLLSQQDPLFRRIFDQERLASYYMLHVFGAKRFRILRYVKGERKYLNAYCSLGISNLMNRKDIRLTGYEQLRYDFENNNPDKFPNKYLYAFGRSFFAQFSISL